MRNLKNWMLAAILICGTSVFTACSSSDDDDSQPDINLAEKIIGRWMVAETNGQPCPTNLKTVLNFVSSTKAYGRVSDISTLSWNERAEFDITFKEGNKMSLVQKVGNNSNVLDCTVLSITNTEMLMSSDWNEYVNGVSFAHEVYTKERYARVTSDYQEAIVGTWQGKTTSSEDEHTDGDLHRWEYKTDGTYVYYNKVGDEWVDDVNVFSNYYVDGVLLCTRWKNTVDGEEMREWWEIESIKDGVMKWTALRQREDGTTYTATFQMTKVQ